MNQNELQNARVQNLATAPSSPVVGQIYYNSVSNASWIWNGTSWQPTDASLSTIIPTSAIVSFAATVQGYHLNQFAAPTANLPMAGFQITGLNTAQSATGQAASWDFVTGRNLNTIAGAAATTASWGNGGYKIQNVGTPSTAGDAAEYTWVNSRPLNTFAVPTANIPMAGFTLTGLNVGPSAAGQAAEYSWVIGQVQSAAAGIASKPPVQCISTSNITLSGLQTLDGYTTIANDRVLVAGQTTQSANGAYNASAGAWTRVTDDGAAPGEIQPGSTWLVVNGTVYGGTQWRCSNTGTITLGTTSITMVQFSAASVYTAGNGITLTGTAWSVNAAASAGSGGPGGGLVVSGSGVAIDTTVVARKYSATIGDGSTTAIVVTHGLGTQDVMMQVKMSGTPYSEVECDMAATSTTTATFTFATAPASGAYRVIVLG
jgi:hypothetical protein